MHRTFPPLLAAAAAVSGPTAAHAAPDLGDVHVDVEAWSRSNPPEMNLTAEHRPAALGSKIVFVNFEGADMNPCGNKPQNNCSTIFTGTVLPFPGDAGLRASIVQIVREKVAPFGISITDERPASGDYDMEMVGPWEGGNPGSAAGIAPNIDCWDYAGGQTSFTMISGAAESVAEVILQEIAHTWGLAHVDDMGDLLFPTTQGMGKTFKDTCVQIVADTNLTPSSSGCSHHVDACGSNSRQNSYQELLMIFGPGTPDTTPPTVEIVEPDDGAAFPSGTDVDVTIVLDDNQTPMLFTTRTILEGTPLAEPQEQIADYAGPSDYTFTLAGLPDGAYTVTFEVSDEEDNEATPASVSFTVGNAGGGNTSGSGGDGGTTSGGGTGAGSATEGGGTTGGDETSGFGDGGMTGGLPGEDPAGASEDGCGCTTHRAPTTAGFGLLLLLAGARRRRS